MMKLNVIKFICLSAILVCDLLNWFKFALYYSLVRICSSRFIHLIWGSVWFKFKLLVLNLIGSRMCLLRIWCFDALCIWFEFEICFTLYFVISIELLLVCHSDSFASSLNFFFYFVNSTHYSIFILFQALLLTNPHLLWTR